VFSAPKAPPPGLPVVFDSGSKIFDKNPPLVSPVMTRCTYGSWGVSPVDSKFLIKSPPYNTTTEEVF